MYHLQQDRICEYGMPTYRRIGWYWEIREASMTYEQPGDLPSKGLEYSEDNETNEERRRDWWRWEVVDHQS